MKTTDRLFREAIKAGSQATAVRVRKGSVEIVADWTRESGWHRLGFEDDCADDLLTDGGRIRDIFTAEARAYREAIGAPEPAPRKAAPKMTAEQKAENEQYWERVHAEHRKSEAEASQRIAAEIEAARLAIEARKNPAPAKPEPAVEGGGYSFPF